jgi:hypothetical protein
MDQRHILAKGENMRTKVNNEEVCHLWAHQAQSHARGPSIFFQDTVIYSYGTHFPMANIVTDKSGSKAVLFTTGTYGPTTAKHLTYTRRACSHMAVFNVPNVRFSFGAFSSESPDTKTLHGFNLAEYGKRIAEQTSKLERCRVWVRGELDRLEKLVAEANVYSGFFKLRKKFKNPYAGDKGEAIVAKKEARQTELDRTRNERQAAQALIEKQRSIRIVCPRIHEARAAQLAELDRLANEARIWKDGGNARYFPASFPTMLRVKGAEVETSRSARFPIEHAIKGLALVRLVRARGEAYQRNGHTLHLGHYAIDRIDASGNVSAGCHYVEYAEIERIAPELEAYQQNNPAPHMQGDTNGL